MGVLAGVVEHLVGDGPDAPVGELVLLVGLDAAVLLEEELEAEAAEVEDARGLAGVEAVDDVHAKVALEPEDVPVAAVEDLEDARVRERRVEQVHVRAQREAVDDKVLRARADLHEAREARVAAVVVRLEVDREHLRGLELRLHRRELRDAVDERERRVRERPVLDLGRRRELPRQVREALDLRPVRVRQHEHALCAIAIARVALDRAAPAQLLRVVVERRVRRPVDAAPRDLEALVLGAHRLERHDRVRLLCEPRLPHTLGVVVHAVLERVLRPAHVLPVEQTHARRRLRCCCRCSCC